MPSNQVVTDERTPEQSTSTSSTATTSITDYNAWNERQIEMLSIQTERKTTEAVPTQPKPEPINPHHLFGQQPQNRKKEYTLTQMLKDFAHSTTTPFVP